MAKNEITKEWVIEMVQFMKKQKKDIASCIMTTASGNFILLETGHIYEIKPVTLPLEMPSQLKDDRIELMPDVAVGPCWTKVFRKKV